MRRPALTAEQLDPATSRAGRCYVEAAPGSGKTYLAVERYGYLRFGLHRRDHRGVAAVSFARSASAELLGRIVRRWGTSSAKWPNFVGTVDELNRRALRHLLETGRVLWPGGLTDVNVADSWRHSPGSRARMGKATEWLGIGLAESGEIELVVRTDKPSGSFFIDREAYVSALASGRCTHDEVRAVLATILLGDSHPGLRDAVSSYLGRSFVHIVVDEAFDMNELDIAVVRLMIEAGVGATIVGDPWQSLYEFRGSRPKLMKTLVADGFEKHTVLGSHRYRTSEMRELAGLLASGQPFQVQIAGASRRPDVVLAGRWSPLWEVLDLPVLPAGIGSRIDGGPFSAALLLLLNEVTTDRFGVAVTGFGEASALLNWDGDRTRLSEALRALADPSAPPEAIWTALATGLAQPDSTWPGPGAMARRRLERLATLIRTGADVVLGLSVHQAKGLEWPAVDYLHSTLAPNVAWRLDQDNQLHREIYVALTRAQDTVRIRYAAPY